MKIFLVILGLMFGSIQAQAEISDSEYEQAFKRMWSGCSHCSKLLYAEVYDVESTGGRWKKVTFSFRFSGGDKGLAYMKVAPRNSGTLIGAKYRCAVIDSRGITLAHSDNCNWLD